jgi:hypothetical protein
VLLFGDEVAFAPHQGPHLPRQPLAKRIEIQDARPQLVLGPVRALPALTWRPLRSRQRLPLHLEPVPPPPLARVRDLVVQHEETTGLEVVAKPPKRLEILLAGCSEAEAATHEDRAVAARHVELVHRLRVQVRGQALALGRLPTEREHVGRDVGAVDVQAGPEVRKEQASRPARDVERRLACLDERAEVVDLRAGEVELGPPACDDAVVPCLGQHLESSWEVVSRLLRRSSAAVGFDLRPKEAGHAS